EHLPEVVHIAAETAALLLQRFLGCPLLRGGIGPDVGGLLPVAGRFVVVGRAFAGHGVAAIIAAGIGVVVVIRIGRGALIVPVAAVIAARVIGGGLGVGAVGRG